MSTATTTRATTRATAITRPSARPVVTPDAAPGGDHEPVAVRARAATTPLGTRRRVRPRRVLAPETALDAPVRAWLEAQGYVVRSEVHDCDLVATRADALVVVELKRQLGLPLLVQATQRQRHADSVYVAVLRPPALRADKRHRAVLHVLRRLELGLLFVTLGRRPRVEVVLHPEPFARRKDRTKRRSLLDEAAARSHDWNRGGSTGRPLVTAYRERALHCAAILERIGPASPARLRDLGTSEKTHGLVYQDVYGWFARVGFASYELTPAGREALSRYADVVESLRERIDAAFASAASREDTARATVAAPARRGRKQATSGDRRPKGAQEIASRDICRVEQPGQRSVPTPRARASRSGARNMGVEK